jgi:hypothetical protein
MPSTTRVCAAMKVKPSDARRVSPADNVCRNLSLPDEVAPIGYGALRVRASHSTVCPGDDSHAECIS